MRHSIQTALSSNLMHKIGALVLGVTLWSILSHTHEETVTVTVPLCFFNTENVHIAAPENVTVTLKGLRRDLHTIDYTTLAVHLDAQKLPQGKSSILLRNKDLFLQKKIKLVSYYPINLEFNVTKK